MRHRVPSIFNLSMVDVLCCALGCVILLWLLNLREVKEKAEEAGRTDQRLADTRNLLAAANAQFDEVGAQYRKLQSDLAESARDLAETHQRLRASEERVRSTTAVLEKTRGEREAARADLTNLNRTLAALRTEKTDIEERLTRQAQDYGDLEKKLSATRQRVASLELQLRDKENLADASARRADGLMGKLQDAEARVRKLQTLADLVPGLQSDLKGTRAKFATEEALAKGLEKEIGERMRELALAAKELKDLRASKSSLEQEAAGRDKELVALRDDRKKLAAAEDRVAELAKEVAVRTKELAQANSQVEGLQSDAKTLRGEAERLRSVADNRFAGITLTGRRVVFLVDMSGSMKLVDENTAAPEKWVGVRDTLTKVLRSLPDLEKFQVVVFAEKPAFLLGPDGRWLDFDANASPGQVREALANLEPKGGTNMYAGLETAFRLRHEGLDTIYLLSDGLPNLGEGITEQQARTLTEQQQGEILGRHIRQTLKTDWNRPLAGKPRVRINTIGFFFESPDVGAFLWALARENDGSFVGMSRP
jgi:septal ring factor EnvC (AmiA/AmiB activator)